MSEDKQAQENAEEPVTEEPEAGPEKRTVTDEDPFRAEDGDERGLFGRFTRKLRDRRELSEDAWKAIGTVLTTSDRAKSEFIRMLGREVRHYLDGLQLTEDLRELVTSHSLEVHASFSLKPLAGEPPEEEPPGEPADEQDQELAED